MRRHAEPELAPEANSSLHVPRNAAQRRDPSQNQRLYDHRKDDPVRFSVLARPSSNNMRQQAASKPSGDYVSASSTSSYAHSMASSSFTLSSGTTDNSSASSAVFDVHGKPKDDAGNNAFAVQLKKLYRNISALESKILNEDADDHADEGRVLLQSRSRGVSEDEAEQTKWVRIISDHKQLAELMHTLMEISLSPSVPASLRVIPTKYNIIIRLWTHGFHKVLESLRRASFSSPIALEHLQDFIYFAYTFYTGLLEEPALRSFRGGWLEALGDLARYRMAVAAMVNNNQIAGAALTTDAVSQAAANTVDDTLKGPKSHTSAKSSGNRPAARIDDSPTPSVGIVAARNMVVEPEKERWRCIARDWFAQGLADTPGAGKLHHHLGLLSREVEAEELRAVYHFVKSMTTLHPFSTSRESILPIWSLAAQTRRSQPDARAPELFVLLHGMLFTNIQLDDFQPTLARFLERLEIEGAEEREWIMMAVINISSLLEYGRPSGLLRKLGASGTRDIGSSNVRVAKRPAQQDGMDVDEDGDEDMKPSPAMSEPSVGAEAPLQLKLAMQLAFTMLSFVLKNPLRKNSQFSRPSVNSYIPVILTFLATVLKQSDILSTLERSVPWEELANFFSSLPQNVMINQGLLAPSLGHERWAMLTSGCAPPLPEDWCLRGMEWVGRKVFERGYWKGGEEQRAEVEILDVVEDQVVDDGVIEDDEEDGVSRKSKVSDSTRRWTRIARCAVTISQVVDGFNWVEGTRAWKVEGALESKAQQWSVEDKREREEEERRRSRRWVDDSMDVDDEAGLDEESEESDGGEDSEAVRELKARRQYLRSMLASSGRTGSGIRHDRVRRNRTIKPQHNLKIVPGYTNLVLDTNILLSSLSIISSIVQSLTWTIVLPVPVIMELDGLKSNDSQLGQAAKAALAFVTSHIHSHSTSLKVQTSKGNYLTSLVIRTEQIDFDGQDSWDRSMDDLILKAAIWQDEHWVDRSALLKAPTHPVDPTGAVKVVLLSFDRNLRLKARSRELPAAGESDLAAILAMES
ncbi:hypothetical protein CONPUDRAFT_141912 [Coniophora puteana RWD-64-598 SS2]|uniref:PIN domain-containing protein n=1 Tax=Coniophora puteana (strain RWD-64-598) TaxID=741705 RepID=A0A5M3N2X0_CONPW|nr:uncharacterized protein CONPUDRAFT_141912 [Coniophora puteana RWD-64-598 SS2]EIW85261.1 hypothetical protein CONPUDRAFT_141912 [Coniophora puteana RWD-64-598 SS2]